jgi:hypothetical protein
LTLTAKVGLGTRGPVPRPNIGNVATASAATDHRQRVGAEPGLTDGIESVVRARQIR